MLAKESIGLPDIIKILGDRPFPMKETVREYLQEMMERKEKEDSEKTTTASEEGPAATGEEAKKEIQKQFNLKDDRFWRYF